MDALICITAYLAWSERPLLAHSGPSSQLARPLRARSGRCGIFRFLLESD